MVAHRIVANRTPGPWSVWPHKFKPPVSQMVGVALGELGGRSKFIVSNSAIVSEEVAGNARLFAAGLDLLEILQELTIYHYGTEAERADQIERYNRLSPAELAAQMEHDARAALAKAEG